MGTDAVQREKEGRERTVREELAEHEGVVGLGVVLGQADVLVHVEGDDVLEAAPRRAGSAVVHLAPHSPLKRGRDSRKLALLNEFYEVLVCRDGRRARRKPEHERLLRRRLEVIYARDHSAVGVSQCPSTVQK